MQLQQQERKRLQQLGLERQQLGLQQLELEQQALQLAFRHKRSKTKPTEQQRSERTISWYFLIY